MINSIMQEKLHHIETEINGYPKWLLKQKFDSFKTSNKSYNTNINNKSNDTNIDKLPDKILHTLKLSCKSNHSSNLMKSIKTSTKKTLPEKHFARITLTSTKLSSQCNIKDVANK